MFKSKLSHIGILAIVFAVAACSQSDKVDELTAYLQSEKSLKGRDQLLARQLNELNAQFEKAKKERHALDESRFQLNEPVQSPERQKPFSDADNFLTADEKAKKKDSYVVKVHTDLSSLISNAEALVKSSKQSAAPEKLPACFNQLQGYLDDAKKAYNSFIPRMPIEDTPLKRQEWDLSAKQSEIQDRYKPGQYKNLTQNEALAHEFRIGLNAFNRQINLTKPVYEEQKEWLYEPYLDLWQARTLLTLWLPKCRQEVRASQNMAALRGIIPN